MMSLGRRTRIRVSLDDRPGELNSFLKTIGEDMGNIITIQQDRYREGLSMYHLRGSRRRRNIGSGT